MDKKIKVCAYAICKNEIQYIDHWVEMLAEADYICVLDTGSTDGSYEKLKANPKITVVKQKEIKPWRFDVARNESLKLCPEDTDVYFCIDFDETVTPGWANIIRETFSKNDINRIQYEYSWSKSSIGQPANIFTYDKIHTKDFYWKFPVHEVLFPKNGIEQRVYDVKFDIFVQHNQNPNTDRNNYMPLLQLSVKENPEDCHQSMMLAREYLIEEDYDKALELYLKTLTLKEINEPTKKIVLLECLGRCADIYRLKGEYTKAISYCMQFLALDYTYREPYLILAACYTATNLFALAEATVNTCLKYTIRKTDWVEREESWTYGPDQLLSDAYFGLGNVKDSIYHLELALRFAPDNKVLLANYKVALQVEADRVTTALATLNKNK